jgi:hypothetical protein
MRALAIFLQLMIFYAGGAAAADMIFTCDSGPLTKNATEKSLVQAFGAANVSRTKVLWMPTDGELSTVTQLFTKKSSKVLLVLWRDEVKHSGIGEVRTGIDAGTSGEWRGPSGIHVGSSLEDVEAANGRPFEFTYWAVDEFPGWVMDWKGGALDRATKNCSFKVQLSGDEGASFDSSTLQSGDQKVRAAHVKVTDMSLSYPGRD